jgi:threonine dehydrogenase-like Zn-dependent dehydrogenase
VEKAIYHGIQDIRVGEVPDLDPGPGDVEVKIKYRGICGLSSRRVRTFMR